jgi:hypothetical protein
MACHDYNRLRHHYEEALQQWGQVLLTPVTGPTGATERLAGEIKQKASEERNAAHDRRCLHKKIWPACNPKLKATYSSSERRPGTRDGRRWRSKGHRWQKNSDQSNGRPAQVVHFRFQFADHDFVPVHLRPLHDLHAFLKPVLESQ